jgi:hypothetical protein
VEINVSNPSHLTHSKVQPFMVETKKKQGIEKLLVKRKPCIMEMIAKVLQEQL